MVSAPVKTIVFPAREEPPPPPLALAVAAFLGAAFYERKDEQIRSDHTRSDGSSLGNLKNIIIRWDILLHIVSLATNLLGSFLLFLVITSTIRVVFRLSLRCLLGRRRSSTTATTASSLRRSSEYGQFRCGRRRQCTKPIILGIKIPL
jgi:hypothetical protein